MDAKQFLEALSEQELFAVQNGLPAEFERRGLALPTIAGSLALEGAAQPEALITRESLTEQLTSAYAGYRSVTERLNESRRKKEQLEVASQETLVSELAAWLTEDKFEHIVKAQEKDPSLRFTLVATPNVLATAQEIAGTARAFGKDQPYETHVWDELYGKYTPEQLSGTNPANGNAVVFSLMPNKIDERLYGTVSQQRTKLAELQASNPNLKVPSVLETVTYWQTLRAQGNQLANGADTFDETYIRHFNLPQKRFDGWGDVPCSYVSNGGEPDLDFSGVDVGDRARVSVG